VRRAQLFTTARRGGLQRGLHAADNRGIRHSALHTVTFVETVRGLYAVTGVVVLASYLPQLRASLRSAPGSRDVSLLTWGSWVCTASISALYAGAVLHDRGYLLLALGNVVGSSSVFLTTLWRRYFGAAAVPWRRRRAQPSGPGPIAG